MSNSPLNENPHRTQRTMRVGLGIPSQQELDELSRSVAALHVEMAQRISREEGRGGFFAFISLAAPRYLTFLETLRAEHHHLLGALTALRAKIARADPSQWDDLLAETDAVLSAIEEHEELEREVLRDALEP